MKAQRIILLTLATVVISVLATACATKARFALHAKLQSFGPGLTPANASRLKVLPTSPPTSLDRPQPNLPIEAMSTPIETSAHLLHPVQDTNLVIASSTDNTRTNPAPSPAIQRAESKPHGALAPAATLGARITTGEKSVVFWIGIFILACLFLPATAPLAGRILAAVVSRTPTLAGLTGVVSVEAFDALIKAIERSKQKPRLDNDNNSAANPFDELHSNLERELAASHKRLVHARKQKLLRTLQLHDSP